VTASEAAARSEFPAGWYGKMPAAGDFVARRIPPAFLQAWHAWLPAALEGSRQRLAGRWRDEFLSMPAWRFVFSPGLVTASAWAGLMLPSVDAVGRPFPLAIASALPAQDLDLVATLLAARSWFATLEKIALPALAGTADPATVDAAIAAEAFRAQWLCRGERRSFAVLGAVCIDPPDESERGEAALRAELQRLPRPRAVWLAQPTEIFGRSLLLCEALPTPEQFCAMMNGRWLEHGWTGSPCRSR
jgi:type VI secretion system protein ImpM